MKPIRCRTVATVAACAAALTAAPSALAHQTVTSNGVSVTVHVAPDDEPQAGQPAAINVLGARRKGYRFSFKTCGCRLTVSDSSGAKLLDRAVRAKRTAFTFPSSGAYEITVSGRVRRGRSSRKFTARFAYRAF
jgi:uncharacterized ParB-like nuclease family protein